MANGLNIGRLVRVAVNLAPLAASRRGFGTLLILGDSDVIDGLERLRVYTALDEVAQDFGLLAPEYLAAALYFGQSPRPNQLMIGRWMRTASTALLRGGILTIAEQAMSEWTTIIDGTFTITVDGGSPQNVTDLDFSLETTLDGVAAVITAGMVGAVCTWTGSRFEIRSVSTGATASLSYAEHLAGGTALEDKIKCSATTATSLVQGYDAEAPDYAVDVLAEKSAVWYGVTFAAATMPTPVQLVAVGTYIESLLLSRILGVTETDTRVLDSTYDADLASVFKALGFRRTCVQYSANPYAICSLMGRAFSVNFAANRSTITLMYKQEPGVVAEGITETQAQTLKAKRCNVFVAYQNDTAIIQYGVMSGDAYFDEVHGLDWFTDALQNAEYNLLYQSKTKIPQTDAGQNQLVNVAASVCNEAINNGLVAAGTWNADGFGQLERGMFLGQGYYIYTPPMAAQDQATREQRIAPPIQIALKLAGAIHELDVQVDVNR